MKKLLLTGGRGFVGRTIREILMVDSQRYALQVVGQHQEIHLSDCAGLKEVISQSQPDFVIHLAAQSFVPESFKNPRETIESNFYGTLNLLEALKMCSFRGRLLYVSSADVYGVVSPETLPITENYLPRPLNPYAVSKVAAEALCYQWSQTEEFEIVIVRPFNHIGPGQNECFVISDFAKQIVEIKLGKRKSALNVGDIDVTRDFTDVRDVVRAYFMLLEHGTNGEFYNLCSGREQSISDLLNKLLTIFRIKADVIQNSERLRHVDQKRAFGTYKKLYECTGWKPEITIEQSLTDILVNWEEKLKSG